MLINNLTEMHCHILPGIDDGAKDIETSLAMIERLREQGAQKIVLTPHYYSDDISLDDLLRRRDRAVNTLLRELPPGYPQLIPGAEVYISDYLFNNPNLDELKIGNSDYILIEHPFSTDFSQKTYDRLINLNLDYGARPILAHIERYKALMDEKYLLNEYVEMGCLAQVNISSFASASRHIRKKLFKFLDAGLIHLIGSDCHNLDTRPPEYADGAKEIIKKCTQETLGRLIQNANEITK